ncbi:DUF308 domain-containing protein [Halorubrum halodurans]|uniref:DUF7319 domain-containing protein n=1 Tax=Halorubrum halodurans TaxID=1383851 RepID=A0A256IFZ8_9EURY|nr:DUF308 domain-containing protein [Halorubrum halodurans]OYR55465.1 hypothetical protein DJ70_11870 [Halorubrum halodurans]
MEDTSTRSDPDGRDGEAVEDGTRGREARETPDGPDVDAPRDGTDDPDAGRESGPEDGAAADRTDPSDGSDADDELAELRERVDAEYDFDDFGPADMARMSAEEWDAAFDPDTWITGSRLLDRVESELKSRIARREVFGLLERVREDGEERVLVYSDEGYAIVRPSGEVSGRGTVLRDVEPLVALAAMEEYDVADPPEDWSLPHPDTVPEGSGEFGNLIIQIVAAVQVIAGVALLAASFLMDLGSIVGPAMGIVFLLVGLFLFAMVANARLSDRFRSEEYRDRLRALREAEERPEFVPVDGEALSEESDDR